MTTLSGSTALDVVLRAHESIAVLPNVVRSIRRFARAPLIHRLKHVLMSPGISADTRDLLIERFVAEDNDDLRLDALESGREYEPVRLRRDQDEIVNKAAVCAAEQGSIQFIEWALSASPRVHLILLMVAAIRHHQLAVVQFLHPQMKGWCTSSSSDKYLLDVAIRASDHNKDTNILR